MDGVYEFGLLVKIEENQIPKLKNKLVKYFQSKKANGSDCQIEYENGSRTAVVRFRTDEARQRVLEKHGHELMLDKGALKLTVCLPEDEKSAEETPPDDPKQTSDVAVNNKQPSADGCTLVPETKEEAESCDEELCSTSAVLGNIPLNFNKEFLEMIVENILKSSDSPNATHDWSVEAIPAMSSAVVTFKSGQENVDFIARCPTNRIFKAKGLSVRPLEVTAQATIESTQNVNEEALLLYFEIEGGEVENVRLNEEDQSTVITFKTPQAVHKILNKQHHINQEAIKVYPFYECLGTALYGESKPPPKLPAALSESIDSAVSKYLSGNPKAVQTIQSDLEKHFCKLDFQESTVRLIPLPSLLRQTAKDIKDWKDTMRAAFAQTLSRFKSQKFHPEADAWEECEWRIREVLQRECVDVVPDQANGVLSVVGLVDDVERLERGLRDVLNKIAKRVHREKFSKTHEIEVPQSIFLILCQDGLKDRLLLDYPEVKMSYNNESQKLMVNGLKEEVFGIDKGILNAVLVLKRQNLVMDPSVLDFLKGEPQNEITQALLTSSGINAALEINGQRVQLLAGSDQELNDAEDHLKRLLISECIDVEDVNVLKKKEWHYLVLSKNDNKDSSKKILIQTKGQQVVVSGYKAIVEKVSHELDDFLQQNAEITETVEVKPNIKVKYIEKNKSLWLEQMKDKVEVSFGNGAIYLRGSRANVTNCKSFFADLVSSLFFQSLSVTKAGVKKFFQEKEKMYLPVIMNDTGCLVQLVDQTSSGQGAPGLIQPVYQCQTPDGVTITVCKSDMCSFPVHAVANSATTDLKLQSGLSKALLDAAGPQLQDECDRIIHQDGKLRYGDCVITGAGGRLNCKKIIHAAGPTYKQDDDKLAVTQLRKTIQEILYLAERSNCDSVALPAISRNQGFPLNLCANTIIKAVKSYCDGADDDNTLKWIHLVNNEDSAVQAMEDAVKQVFGNHGVTHSQHNPFTKVTRPPPPVRHVALDPNILNQVLTKEGVDVTLMKGNIEKSTTEVTVNTVSEDLVLGRGAISNAIFTAAGRKLQQLINQQQPSGNVGDIIVTNGCELMSSQIFHAVAPSWDNGQGQSEKILTGIFKDCLSKAEASRQTSITFPAVGTGNLGFPKDLVASIMLNEILEFSTKKHPKHLKKVVIVLYPTDLQTIQAFGDEFKKPLAGASGGPVPTTSSQTPGPFSKIISSSGKHETKMGSVDIQVVTGDITKETTDVVVNSSNEGFSLKSGVSKAILDAAGPTVEAECQTLVAQAKQVMIMTQAGNLQCKKILHLVGQTKPQKIHAAVRDALQMCVKHSHTSVSFPAIGTGQGNVHARQVADAMLDAVVDVLNQNTSSSLKTIRIVIFQQPMLKEFYSSMQQKQTADPKDKAGLLQSLANFGSKLKSYFGGVSADKLPQGDFVIEGQKVDPVCFHICGDSQAKVDSAEKQINDLTAGEHNSNCITDNALLSFSKTDHQHIVDIQKTMGVSIRIENKNSQAVVTIEGLSKDVQKASNEIHKMLREVKDENELKARAEMTATLVDWQYQQQGKNFQSFDSITNLKLEEAMERNQRVKVRVLGQDYMVTMPDGPATDTQGNTLQIKRIDKLQAQQSPLPDHWDPMPGNSTCLVVPIQPGTPEYKEVLTLFQATCNKSVLKMERIQNESLWRSLQIKKKDMEKRNGHQNNERRLFHGTCSSTIDVINKRGFNRSYAGKNATCYGNGTYFAVNASYSAGDTYSRPDALGQKSMYVCRVLTGDFTVGRSGIIVPPDKSSNATEQYDSVVDNAARPNMFVIFHDSHACPEYLITFK
ncbi:poly(ADP-ribose) polymerase family member 14-related sequence 1 isoform X2 [Genypterus blacodes]|uniref:poly(ADP-ribose) polymerase family member 14-related sequence 1 isoform X2 n=1 Tax=Genypterus blacodes TaxID=154954 RepID=UPI003F76B848